MKTTFWRQVDRAIDGGRVLKVIELLVKRCKELEKRVADLEKEDRNRKAGYPGFD